MNWILLAICLCLAACSTEPKPSSTTLLSGNAMTMDYRIIVGAELSQEERKRAQDAIHRVFDEVNEIYNHWNANSELSHLNQQPAGVKAPLSQKLETFLQRTGQIVELTEGRFDPTVAPVQRLWKEKLLRGETPSDEQIQALAKAVGWDKIHVQEGLFWKDHALTCLDLGGIAKGYCVDLLIEALNSQGYGNVYAEWGGEIRASGRHPDQRPWNIYISRMGDPDPEHAISTISLTDQAIATSGDYMQSWKVGNMTYFHIIDPRTLKPLAATQTSVSSASVIAPSCMLADGLATAAMIFESVEDSKRWAETLQKKVDGLQFWIVSREQQ